MILEYKLDYVELFGQVRAAAINLRVLFQDIRQIFFARALEREFREVHRLICQEVDCGGNKRAAFRDAFDRDIVFDCV